MKKITNFFIITILLIFSTPIQAKSYNSGGLIRASWYGGGEHLNKYTANREKFKSTSMTAAHRSLPFGSVVRVTNLANGKTVIVRINDRGPAKSTGRSIDLSKSAAISLGMKDSGTALVKIIRIN